MKEVRIHALELRKILLDNRETHRKDWDAAMADWQKVASVALSKAMEEVHNGTWKGWVKLDQPHSHLADYDRAVRMLDLSVDDIVTLTEEEFSQLVLDEWVWSATFKALARSYTELSKS